MRWIGQYQVFEEIGRGASGVVYRALDPAIGRDLAIKQLRLPQLAADEIPEELVREARAVGNLRHDNIVTFYEFIREKNSLYAVTEFVPGESLQKFISGGRPPTTGEASGIIRQVAAALDRAHANGIVHRNIKPGNILVSNDRSRGLLVKVTDFDIGRISSKTMTAPGVSLETPAYMAPEQLQGFKGDAKADQFSLGVVAYQLFAGRLPFNAPDDQALMIQIANAEPASLVKANVDLPLEVEQVIRRALAKNPAHRFESCGGFGDALEQAMSPLAARRKAGSGSGVRLLLAAAALLLVIATGLYIAFWRG